MSKIRENIAVFLCWIFIFPIVFQSLHIVVHHFNLDFHNSETCNHDASQQAFLHQYTIKTQRDKLCAICNYQFSVNDLPNILFFRSAVPRIKNIFNVIEVRLPFQILFSQKSPRAPPVIFS